MKKFDIKTLIHKDNPMKKGVMDQCFDLKELNLHLLNKKHQSLGQGRIKKKGSRS